RAGRSLLEAVQVGKEFLINEVPEVIADHRGVVIQLAIGSLGRSPTLPTIRLLENVFVFLSVERRFVGLILFESVEIFQEKQPGSLFGVVEFRSATGFFPKYIVDVPKGLLE